MNWVQAGFTWVRLRKIDRTTEVVPLKKETGGGGSDVSCQETTNFHFYQLVQKLNKTFNFRFQI